MKSIREVRSIPKAVPRKSQPYERKYLLEGASGKTRKSQPKFANKSSAHVKDFLFYSIILVRVWDIFTDRGFLLQWTLIESTWREHIRTTY